MRTRLPFCALILFLGWPSLADQPAQKASWQWTLDERISTRTNPELARVRVRERGRRVQTSSTESSARQIADAFDGQTHPELFLPYQVFDELITMAFIADPRTTQLVREGLLPEVRRHGLPADFWDRLRTISTVHVADSRTVMDMLASEQRQPARERNRIAVAQKHKDMCRSRADALAAARHEFGRDRFDRFLYEVIAVSMFSMTDRLPDPVLLRQAEEGCR